MGNNPVRMLETVSSERLLGASENASYMNLFGQIFQQFDKYMDDTTPSPQIGPPDGLKWSSLVAYFSTEYVLHDCLPIYSGGLGTLSGDHLKTASDLNIPLVGVGLLYKNGFFKQVIDQERRPDGGVSRERFLPNAAGDRPRRPGGCRTGLPGTSRPDALRKHLGGPCGARLALPFGLST